MTSEIEKLGKASSFEECMSQEMTLLSEKEPKILDPQKTAIALNVCRKQFPTSSKAMILRMMENKTTGGEKSLEPLIKSVKNSLSRDELVEYSVLLRQEGLNTNEVASLIKYKSSWVKKYINPIFKAVTELEKLEIEDLSGVTQDGEIRKSLMKATVSRINEEKREFEAWATAEVIDSEDEIIEAAGVVETMPTYMERGGVLLYGHSNRHVGKTLKWKSQDKTVQGKSVPSVWIHGKVYNHYEIDDQAWADVKRAKESGKPFLSIGATPTQDRYDCEGDKCRRVVEKEQLYEITITELGKGSQGANPEATLERTIEKNESVALLLSDLYKSVVSSGAEEFSSLTKAGLDEIEASEIILKDVLTKMVDPKEEIKEEDPIQEEPEEEKADFMKDLGAMLKEIHGMLKALTQKGEPEEEPAAPLPEEPEGPQEPPQEKDKSQPPAPESEEALTLSKTQFLQLAKANGYKVIETKSPTVSNSRTQITKNVPEVKKALPTSEELSDAMRNSRSGDLSRLSKKYGFD